MLKLIHAFDMNPKNVKEYYDSFDMGKKDINCYAITLINNVYEYYNYVKKFQPNLYYLVDSENENYIIGFGAINDYAFGNILENNNTGNISCGIRSNERGKGYCKELLKQLLNVCEEMGMSKVSVSCLKDNISSKKVILYNNGKLEKEFIDYNTLKIGLKYTIKVKPKLKNKIKRIKKIISNF